MWKDEKIILRYLWLVYFSEKKTLALFIISSKCKNEDEKLIMKEESIEVLKMVGLIEST